MISGALQRLPPANNEPTLARARVASATACSSAQALSTKNNRWRFPAYGGIGEGRLTPQLFRAGCRYAGDPPLLSHSSSDNRLSNRWGRVHCALLAAALPNCCRTCGAVRMRNADRNEPGPGFDSTYTRVRDSNTNAEATSRCVFSGTHRIPFSFKWRQPTDESGPLLLCVVAK